MPIAPEITKERLILEPQARNTAPAIALVAATIAEYDSEAVIATIASDHAIENPEEFQAAIKAAFATVTLKRDKLVTIGINPTHPDTGLGYIKMGQEFTTSLGKRVFVVEAFKEKPDRKTAEEYLSSWEYLWNAGYFIFAAESFGEWTKRCSPLLHDAIEKIIAHKTAGTLDEKTLRELYEKTPSEPIDTLIVEKLSREERLVIPAPLKWSDVGNWETLYAFLSEKSATDSVIQGDHLDIGSKHLLVHSEKRLIATVGLEDLIIVDTDDALLVARRDRVSGDIKKLIEKIKSEAKETLL